MISTSAVGVSSEECRSRAIFTQCMRPHQSHAFATPGGAMRARVDAFDLSRFPGMQPFGTYPIHIIVRNGRTTLLGIVDGESDKRLAELRARDVPQVFNVENDLVLSTKE